MRYLLFILCLGFTFNGLAQQIDFEKEEAAAEAQEVKLQTATSKLTWLTNIDEALKLSKVNNKQVLVYFTGSDWCSPCVALKKDFFETPEFEKRADKLILVMIDYPRRKDILLEKQMAYNRKMITKYNTSKTFPKLIMLNKYGSDVGKLSGYSSYNTYQDTSYHFNFVDKYISH